MAKEKPKTSSASSCRTPNCSNPSPPPPNPKNPLPPDPHHNPLTRSYYARRTSTGTVSTRRNGRSLRVRVVDEQGIQAQERRGQERRQTRRSNARRTSLGFDQPHFR